METHSYPFLFLLVPILIFGPVFGLMLWSFGAKSLFRNSPETRDRKLREKQERQADQVRRCDAESALGQTWRQTPLTYLGQAAAYGAFAVTIGYFSSHPQYRTLPDNTGELKLSLSHPGQRKVPCKQRSEQELARLAPNMRTAMACERARWPVSVTLTVDGQPVFRQTVAPAGFASDGVSSFYKVVFLPAGQYRLVAELNDNGGSAAGDHFEQNIRLGSAQVLVVGFREEPRGFFVE
ncbi:MAG: hypothetical protein ABT940_08790 [Alphaproteobacteria bacterium]